MERITNCLNWVEDNKNSIIQQLLVDGFLELAEEWVTNTDNYIVKDGKTFYLLYDDDIQSEVKIEIPISIETFKKGIQLSTLNCALEKDNICFILNMYTQPNYFTDHGMEVFVEIDLDKNIKITTNGLNG